MKPLRPLAFAAALALAACTASPTDAPTLDPAGPSFDGINTLGTGNNTAPDGTNPIGSGTFSTEDGGGSLGSGNFSGEGVANDTTSSGTQRGGNMIGSGN